MTGITREKIDRLRCGPRCAYVPTYELDAILDAAERSLSEQSRIDEAVAKERERCIAVVRFYNGMEQGAHRALRDLLSTTPTTEEGA